MTNPIQQFVRGLHYRSNSEAFASVLENREKMFSRYYMHSDVFNSFKSSITHYCVIYINVRCAHFFRILKYMFKNLHSMLYIISFQSPIPYFDADWQAYCYNHWKKHGCFLCVMPCFVIGLVLCRFDVSIVLCWFNVSLVLCRFGVSLSCVGFVLV